MRTSVGKRLCQESRNGTRPRVLIRVTIGVDTVDVMTLWDTGASCFVIFERLVSKDGYQRVKRDHETMIHDYAGRTKPGGQFYTKPLPFSLAGKKFKEPMEVAPLREIVGYDIIIPNWWIEESGLTLGRKNGVYKVSDPEAAEPPQQPTPEPIRTGKTVGRELTGQQAPTTGSFTIEWDESILIEDEEPIQCGFVCHSFGALKMTLDG